MLRPIAGRGNPRGAADAEFDWAAD